MKRMFTSLHKRASSQALPAQDNPKSSVPDTAIVREITAFCESSAPNSPSAGDEFLHLPAIVEAAESNPATAREGALAIQRYLGTEYDTRAYAQYNAIMLIRILTDNPGPTFTRSFDASFVKTVKELLREGSDLSVQQMLRETLDSLQSKQKEDASLGPLMDMWRKEKAKSNTPAYGNRARSRMAHGAHGAGQASQPGNHFARSHRQPNTLPPPDELAARIEEAKTTAKLLSQTVQSTPAAGVPANDLIREFADRAASASRSIQAYIHCNNPPPDEDTLLTLIETNDNLSVAMSKHQRALLQARRAMNNSPPVGPPTPDIAFAVPSGPPPGHAALGQKGGRHQPSPISPPQRAHNHVYNQPNQKTPPTQSQHGFQPSHQKQQSSMYDASDNPFDDSHSRAPQHSYGLFAQSNLSPSSAPADPPRQLQAPLEPERTQRGPDPSQPYQSPSNTTYQRNQL